MVTRTRVCGLTDRVRVVRSGDASTNHGYANTGVHIGDVNLVTGVPVRTRYREQVRRIAPTELIDRETELDELASFCTSADTAGSYLWCRAPAWSGKSSLMSWFVMHPPEGVRIVSFFITARMAGQSDRSAFIDNLLEQLATLLGQGMPAFLTESTREAHLLAMLTEVAETCASRGEPFVLLVDGLDEDRGVTAGPDAHSIAALLPVVLPHGMRVIVASRPAPPLPSDVRADHPLHDPGVIWPLVAYVRSDQVRDQMENELQRLLEGAPLEQDLLGLLAAAGGGLTAADLAELSREGLSTWQVERCLRAVAGRSFSRRGSAFAPGSLPDSYVLGHEELHATALRLLGDVNLARYRDRLHVWAEKYRDQGWPPNTPEYLLLGYHALLAQQHDLPRMIEYATDPARHDRQLSTSGTDHHAAVENHTTQQLLRAHSPVDHRAWLRLALHLDRLRNRGTGMPPSVARGWAKLGQLDKAEQLARETGDPANEAYGLSGVAVEAWLLGDAERSRRLTAEVAVIMATEERAFTRGHNVVALVWAAAQVGDWPVVESALAKIEGQDELVHAFLVAAHTAGERADANQVLGLLRRARDAASNRSDTRSMAEVLASIANEAANVGAREEAKRLLQEAKSYANTCASPQQQAIALATIARIAVASRLVDPRPFVDAAEPLAWGDEQGDTAAALAWISIALAESGDTRRAMAMLDDAERVRAFVKRHDRRADAARAVVTAAVAVGLVDRALGVITTTTDELDQARMLQAAMGQAHHCRDLDAVERLARAMPLPSSWNHALARTAVAVIEAGDPARGQDLLREVESKVRQETRFTAPDSLLEIIRAEVWAGHAQRAETISQLFLPISHQVTALHELARYRASRSESEEVDRLLITAEKMIATASSGWNGADGFVALAVTAMTTGRTVDAERFARKAGELANAFADQEIRVEALSWIAAMAMSGSLMEHGRFWLEEAKSISRTLAQHQVRRGSLVAMVAAAATSGDKEAVRSLLARAGWSHRSLKVQSIVNAAVGKIDYQNMQSLLNLALPPVMPPSNSQSELQASSMLALTAAEVGRRGEAAYFLRDVLARLRTGEGSTGAPLSSIKAAIALGRYALARMLFNSTLDGDLNAAASAGAAQLAFQLDMKAQYFAIVGRMLADGRWSVAATALRAIDPAVTQLAMGELARIS